MFSIGVLFRVERTTDMKVEVRFGKLDQVTGMGKAVRVRRILSVVLRGIAAQSHQMPDARSLQGRQNIMDLVF